MCGNVMEIDVTSQPGRKLFRNITTDFSLAGTEASTQLPDRLISGFETSGTEVKRIPICQGLRTD